MRVDLTPSVKVFVSENLGDWFKTWSEYERLFRGSLPEALAKQSKEFTNACYIAARAVAPAKGSIRAERLAAFKSGKGLLIHDQRMPNPWGGGDIHQSDLLAARLNTATKWRSKKARDNATRAQAMHMGILVAMGKRVGVHKLAWQAMLADLEIATRESHRMFAASAWQFKGSKFDQKVSSAFAHMAATGSSSAVELNRHFNKQEAAGPTAQFLMGNSVSPASSHIAAIYTTPKGHKIIDRALISTRENMQKYIDRKHQEAASRAARSLR